MVVGYSYVNITSEILNEATYLDRITLVNMYYLLTSPV